MDERPELIGLIRNLYVEPSKTLEAHAFSDLVEEDEVEQEEDEQKEQIEPEPQYDCNELLKKKLGELQELAKDLNIDILKMNPKKTRMINKRKDEIISEILKKN